MENRIRRIEVRDRALDPISAEVWISVIPEQHTPTTEVRGRLMGPRCLFSSTVEVAYPLRSLSLGPQSPSSALTVRAVIPEASLWEPQCPFLYQGPIELWQDGQRCDQVIFRHGLSSFQIKGDGLFVNGRRSTLNGLRVTASSDEEAVKLREGEYNLLIAPVEASCLAVWELADRFGFLVLGQLGKDADQTTLMEKLCAHVSCLGWLDAECRGLRAEEAIAWFMEHGQPSSRHHPRIISSFSREP